MKNHKNESMLSLITPVFNRAKLIEETYESVVHQVAQNWEWIIVDDGSADGTIEVCANYALNHENIHFFQRNRAPKGANTCRNIGLEKASGHLICFLDSDDLLGKDFIANRSRHFQELHNYDFLVFPEWCFNENPKEKIWVAHELYKSTCDMERFLRKDQPFILSGVLWNKKALKRIGAFNEDLSCFQDWELNIRAISCLNYKKISLSTPDFFRRVSDNTSRITNSYTAEGLTNTHIATFSSLYGTSEIKNLVLNNKDIHFEFVAFYLKMARDIAQRNHLEGALYLWSLIKAQHLVPISIWYFWSIWLRFQSNDSHILTSKILQFVANKFFSKYNYPK